MLPIFLTTFQKMRIHIRVLLPSDGKPVFVRITPALPPYNAIIRAVSQNIKYIYGIGTYT